MSLCAVTNCSRTGFGAPGDSRSWGDVLPQQCFLHLPRVLGKAADPAGVSSLWESLWLLLVSQEVAQGMCWHLQGSSGLNSSHSWCCWSDRPPCPACLCSAFFKQSWLMSRREELDPTDPIPGAGAAPTRPKGWQKGPVPLGPQGLTPFQGPGPEKQNSWCKAQLLGLTLCLSRDRAAIPALGWVQGRDF